jgi:glycosyltransferase involved in cell wall biosynthesis
MKVLINRKPLRDQAWGGGNLFVTALCDHLSKNNIEVCHKISSDIDVIFMQDPRYDDLGISINEISNYKRFNPNTKLVHRVNECDARKNTTGMDDLLRLCSTISNHTIFVSEWMKKYHLDLGWACNKNSVIHNGVNLNHFFPGEKLDNNKVNIVAHHWSNNRLKGFDIYEKIDKFVGNNNRFTFTYIGRHNNSFNNTNVIDPLYGFKLGRELSRYDVYVSGSVYDPGPNHILESLACKIPTYVIANGGGAVEFAGDSHTYDSFESLVSILKSMDYKLNEYTPRTWSACVEDYMEIICQK